MCPYYSVPRQPEPGTKAGWNEAFSLQPSSDILILKWGGG